MRPALMLTILLLPASAYAQTKPGGIRFPVLPIAQATSTDKLTGDNLYVLDHDKPFMVIPGSLGIVSITKAAGPMTVFGKFVDGTGKNEIRVYKGSVVYIVQAVGSGKVDLIVIPEGAKEEDILRKPLEVDVGGKPVDPVDPPKKRVAFHVYFIGCDSGVSAKVKNDQGLRDWITGNGMAWDAFSSTAPQVKTLGLEKAVETAGGAPCVLFVGDDGYGVIVGGPVLSVNQVKVLGTPYLRGK